MIDENSVKEGKVCEPKVWEGFDWYWFNSVPIWYLGVWSKLDLYRSAAGMKEVPISELKEDELLNANVVWNAKDAKVSGLGVKNMDAPFQLDEQKRLIFPEDRHSFMFSDNKSYIFGVTEWNDGEQSWGVWSTTKEISGDVKTKIMDHVKQLGFDPELAIETTFIG